MIKGLKKVDMIKGMKKKISFCQLIGQNLRSM